MSKSILEPIESEKQLSAKLRRGAIRMIKEMGEAQAAEELGIFEAGVRDLVEDPEWELSVSFRAAELLGAWEVALEELPGHSD